MGLKSDQAMKKKFVTDKFWKLLAKGQKRSHKVR
jgi:hypothetical protein